jgi:hypothetical protein
MAETITRDFNKLPYTKDYTLRQGDTIEETYHVELNTAGSYVDDDLSGCTVTLDVEEQDGTSAIAARAITPGGDSNNELTILITATDTAAWTGTYLYELKCVWPNADDSFTNGATRVLVAGKIEARNIL